MDVKLTQTPFQSNLDSSGAGADGSTATDSAQSSSLPALKKFRAVYKFHEGSSAAVRKNVKMSTLM